MASAPANPPRPRKIFPLTFLWRRREPLKFLSELTADTPDIAVIQVGPQVIAVIKNPALIQQVLVADSAHTDKGRTAERELFFTFLGEGLLNARGETHRRQRRLMMPGFHRARIKGYADLITASTLARTQDWRDGDEREVNKEMMDLALVVVGRTLFSSDVTEASHAITQGFDQLTRNVGRMILPGARWLLQSPLPFAKRVRDSQQQLDAAVYGLIAKRRSAGLDTGDLLSMLLLAEDAEHPGERLNDTEVRDQIMTILFTGQDPIGNTLTWVWWLLARHPEHQAALHAEVDRVLGGRSGTFDDVSQLTFTEQIVREVLRLYPPLWTLGRKATADLEVGGHTLAPGTLLVTCQWLVQRDARWYEAPDEFRPQRWTPEFRAALSRFAYFPFGGGPRSCIGENFAWMELILIVATIAQQWRFDLSPRTTEVGPQPRITLHPDRPVFLKFIRRS